MKELLIAFAGASFLATVFVTLLGYRVRTPSRLPRESALLDAASHGRGPRRVTAA